MRARARLLFASLALTSAIAAPAQAAPGQLDPTFDGYPSPSGMPGRRIIDLAGTQNEATAVVVAPDGKIVLAGESDASGNPRFTLMQLLPARGASNSAFGQLGVASFSLNSADQAQAYALAQLADGRLLVAGQASNGTDPDMAAALVRNPQGTLDTSYGGGTGSTFADFAGGSDVARAVAIQPGTGRVLFAGTTDDEDIGLVRALNPQGTLDSSFEGGGRATIDIDGRDALSGMALQPDGKILLGGTTRILTGNRDFVVLRRTASGGVDNSFGGDGNTTVDFGHDDAASAIVRQPDGKVLLVGSEIDAPALDAVRLLPNGALDPSFGAGGKVRISFARGLPRENYGAEDMVLQPDGKILVAGNLGYSASAAPSATNFRDMAVTRLRSNGALDTSFGNAGTATVDFATRANLAGIALQRDGKIVVAGSVNRGSERDFAVARLLGDPPPVRPAVKPLRCAGKVATIVGTAGKNKLKGTKKADVIVGLGGNDSISGGGGKDLICAGSGKDKVKGGKGNDRIYGQSGKDNLAGESGNDSLDGGSSADRISGGSGKDKLKGGSGNDRLSGGSGRDKLYGQSGKDRLTGGKGKDLLRGGPGRDKQKQ